MAKRGPKPLPEALRRAEACRLWLAEGETADLAAAAQLVGTTPGSFARQAALLLARRLLRSRSVPPGGPRGG